jgi:hypothetical protein
MSVFFVPINYWRTATQGTAPTSESAQFPFEDTLVDTLYQRWRTTDVSAEDTGWRDLGAVVSIDYVAILGHNLTSAATITIYGADDTSGTNAVNAVITWTTGNIYFPLTSAIEKRYFKITLSDATNTDGYLEIKTIVIGAIFTPTRNGIDTRQAARAEASTSAVSDALVDYTLEKPRLKVWRPIFNKLDDSSSAEILSFLEDVGMAWGFVVCFDSASSVANTHFVKFSSLIEPEKTAYDIWTWEPTLIEVV